MDGTGQVPGLSKTSETLISAALDQNSSRSSSLYQQSPYTTPTKQTTPDNSNTVSANNIISDHCYIYDLCLSLKGDISQ